MNEGFDFSNIVRNIARRWKEIIMIALIAAFAAGTVSCFMYRPEYRTKATIVVLEKEMYKWSGVSNAENTAGIFREIVSSKVLKDKVAASLGLDSLPGTVSCSNIRNTNMMILTVTASSPRDAMLTINGILEHYNEFSETILSDQVLQVLETPKVPESVVNPYSGWGIITKIFLAAAVLEILILFLYFYLHDDIKNPGQIEKKLDTKLIASVYHEKKKRVRKGGGEILVSAPTTSFGYIETFRKIAMKVSYMMKSKKAKTVLVTSVSENEGKSTVAANLALSLSKQGKKVLLIDADLRRPSQCRMFRLNYAENDVQIADILSGTVTDPAAIVRSLKQPGDTSVYILAGNREQRRATSLISGGGIGKIIGVVGEYVDYVVIDTPPMFAAADSEELMRISDAGIIVVRQNCSKTKDINDCIDIFRSTGCELLGCIMNNVDNSIAGSVGYGGDGYYYRYGYGYRYRKNYYGNSYYGKGGSRE